MAKKAALTINFKNLSGFKKSQADFAKFRAKFDNIDDLLQSVADAMEQNYVQPMMRELQQAPRKRKYPADYPIVFASLKQQRFVMAKLGGKPYVRKGDVQSGYAYSVKIVDNKVSFTLDNSSPESKYTVGTWGLGTSTTSIRRYTKTIQPFHAVTGWKPAYQTVQKWMLPAREEAVATIKQWLAGSA